TERLNLMPMTDNLYDGRLGVALFLAALEHATGGAGYRDLALAAMLPLRKALRQPGSAAAVGPLGGAAGLGSQLYALVRIGPWLNDSELAELARRVAGWFVPRRIARDEALDVIGGSAGGILGLLALAQTGANGTALDPAVRCGDHLLEKRADAENGHRAWK